MYQVIGFYWYICMLSGSLGLIPILSRFLCTPLLHPYILVFRIFDLLVSSVFVVLNEECGKSYNEYIVARAVYDIEALCAEVSAVQSWNVDMMAHAAKCENVSFRRNNYDYNIMHVEREKWYICVAYMDIFI